MDVDLSPLVVNWRFLVGGLWLTVLLSLASALAATLVGLIIGLARCYAPWLVRVVLAFYVDSMRAVPVLVVLVWTFFAVPILSGVTLPPFWARSEERRVGKES